MEKLIEQLFRIRNFCRDYHKKLDKVLGIKNNKEDIRTSCFPGIFNKATLTLELLSYYDKIWKKTIKYFKGEEKRKQTIKENAERCIEISKMLFISSMSAIEFSTKNSILLYPKSRLYKFYIEQQKRNRFVSLNNILKESKYFINVREYELWEFLRVVRNSTVHNNCIADRSIKIKIDGRSFELEQDKMIQGKLDYCIFLTNEAVNRYYNWIKKFNKASILAKALNKN